jgi:MFS family permease
MGLFLSLLVILVTRTFAGEPAFADWGWRIPFLVSVLLLLVSLWIRLQLNESPAFARMKAEGTGSKAPLKESFGNWRNGRIALLALLGLTMGQGVVWYTGQFYALFFLQSILKVDGYTANLLIAWALLLGAIFFVVFGWLSDKIGRKPIIMTGCLLAAVTYFPLFKALTAEANPTLAAALDTVKVSVVADPANCGNLFNPVGTRLFTSSCDIARDALAKASVRYTTEDAAPGTPAAIMVNGSSIAVYDATNVPDAKAASATLLKSLNAALQGAGYPKPGDATIVKMSQPFDIFRPQVAAIIGLLFILVLYVTMVYGPIAAALVELFPTRIRYSSMSLPYHIGNGWFGGLLPATAFALVAQTGDIYYGLWYPVIFAAITLVIGTLFVPETKNRSLTD